jgi:hypothetical protein
MEEATIVFHKELQVAIEDVVVEGEHGVLMGRSEKCLCKLNWSFSIWELEILLWNDNLQSFFKQNS